MAEMNRPPFRHSNSSCLTGEDVAETLLRALMSRDLTVFTNTLPAADPEDINKLYAFPNECTLLTAAVEQGLIDYVELLLKHGADVNLESPVRKVSSIHLATRNNDAEIMRMLLHYHADVNCRKAGSGESGKTPLHVLISTWMKSCGPTNESEAETEESKRRKDRWWQCLDVLLSHPQIDVNAEDGSEVTPLELAVRQGLRPLAKKLLGVGAAVNTYVREALEEHPMDGLLDETMQFDGTANNNSQTAEIELWNALIRADLNQFHTTLSSIKSQGVAIDLNNSTSGRPTMLQYCLTHDLDLAVEWLLEADCDPNAISSHDTTPPLIIAANRGNSRALAALYHHRRICVTAVDSFQSKQTPLHKVCQRLSSEKLRYLDCLKILLSPSAAGKRVNVNFQDVSGNTALHYAAHSGVEESVMDLLHHGAHLGIKNILGETAVPKILPETLEKFFDSCVQSNGEQRSSRDFTITFDYSFLAPPHRPAPEGREEAITLTSNHDTEMSDDQIEGRVSPESEALWHMSLSSRHQDLLKHPLVTSFLMLKWKNISKYYYSNVAIYMLFVVLCTLYILLLNSSYATENEAVQYTLSALWYVVIFLVSLLSIREVLQLGIAPLRYIFSFENYIEIAMLVCTGIVLDNWRHPADWRNLSAVAILLAWAELLLLLGRHPRLSTFITMFTTVSSTFLRMLLWYSVLLIGFAFSFFLVFQSEDQKSGEDKDSPFENIPLSLLKVISMLTGEFEYGDLPFNGNPWTSRIIFLLFLFLMTIVLLNLLNGMAISDTQSIQSKAEIIGYARRVELISYLESMLLGDPFNFLANWPPFKWLRFLPSFVSPVANIFRGKWIRKLIHTDGTALFYRCLPRKTLTVFPNRKTAHISNNETCDPTMCDCHADFKLSKEIIQDACFRISERDRIDTSASLLSEVQKLRSTVEQLSSQFAKFIQKNSC